MRCISVINFKGGVGKSSLCINLGHQLARLGSSTLIVDCCLQANSSTLLPTYGPPTLTQVLQGQAEFGAAVRRVREELFLLPADRDLNLAAIYISQRRSAYYTLRNAVQRITRCEYIFFDHAPGYSPVTEAALLASQEILIPCELEPFAVQGLFQMFHKLEETMGDHRLITAGIVPWAVDRRYLMSLKYQADLKKAFGSLVLPAVRSDATFPRSQSVGQTVFEYNAKSRAAKDIRELADALRRQQEISEQETSEWERK